MRSTPKRGGGRRTPPYFYSREVEYEAKRRMLQEGAALTIRSAGSKTQADLVAIFPEKREIWLVQVKAQDAEELGDLGRKFKALKALEGEYKVRSFLFAKKAGRYQFISL